MRLGETGEGQNVAGCTIEVVAGVGETDGVEMVDDTVMLSRYFLRGWLGEDGAHHGRDHRL